MPSPTHEPPVNISARASELRASLEKNLEGCQDLSEVLQFIASTVGDPVNTCSLLTDVEASARVWRGVERVHQELYKDLLLAQEQAGALHDCVAISKGGER